jgi:hypothetical protein
MAGAARPPTLLAKATQGKLAFDWSDRKVGHYAAVELTIVIACIVPGQMLDSNPKLSPKLQYRQILHFIREFWFATKPGTSSFPYHLETSCN